MKVVPKISLHRGKIGQQNSLYQDTTCCVCDSNFWETISSQLKKNYYFRFYMFFWTHAILHQNVFWCQILKTCVNTGWCTTWSFTMSHLVERKYACLRHKNARNIEKYNTHPSKQFMFIVLCIQLQQTYIKNDNNQLLIIVDHPPSPKQSTRADPVFWGRVTLCIQTERQTGIQTLTHPYTHTKIHFHTHAHAHTPT